MSWRCTCGCVERKAAAALPGGPDWADTRRKDVSELPEAAGTRFDAHVANVRQAMSGLSAWTPDTVHNDIAGGRFGVDRSGAPALPAWWHRRPSRTARARQWLAMRIQTVARWIAVDYLD